MASLTVCDRCGKFAQAANARRVHLENKNLIPYKDDEGVHPCRVLVEVTVRREGCDGFEVVDLCAECLGVITVQAAEAIQ